MSATISLDRLNEGYGISMAAAEKMPEMDVDLVITVDCGITAFEEVKYITDNNIDIIITDHHECRESVPDALAVVNPHRFDCAYPFKELAGVGVAYKLLEALSKKMNIPGFERQYLGPCCPGHRGRCGSPFGREQNYSKSTAFL